jgi:hypothetical protein
MRSRVAKEASRARRDRLAALTPAERVALAVRMGEDGLDAYMAQHGLDRRTARARIAMTRRVGRRRSISDEQG